MRTSSTTVDAGRLKLLAEKVNREHRQAQRAAGQAVKHAVEAGELLLKAKEAVGHGGFTKWIEENFEGTQRHATRYMRLATAADQKRIDPAEHSSLTEAESLLRDQDAEPTSEEYEPEVEGEEYEDWDFDDDTPGVAQHGAAEDAAPCAPTAPRAPAPKPKPSKKKDVDPLRDALKAIGKAMTSVEGEKKAEWGRLLHAEIDLYMGPFEVEPKRPRKAAAEKPPKMAEALKS